jgi:hypothetical protein
MADFNWLENSKVVFEEGLKAAPMGFRRISTTNLTKGLVKIVGEGGDVHEADVVRAIKESTPAPFIPLGMKAIKPHLTDASLLDT